MHRRVKLGLVDTRGQPLEGRLARVLRQLAPQLRREFPDLRDDVELIDVLEKAGERIAARETVCGPIERLYRYASITVHREAISRMRLLSHRLLHDAESIDAGLSLLELLQSPWHTAEQIEARVQVRELAAYLTPEENSVCNARRQGMSSKEIARLRGCTVDAVNATYHRAILKMRKVFEDTKPPGCRTPLAEGEASSVKSVRSRTADVTRDDDIRKAG
jgi:DNA-directed RNA polymerase specialized sigma24 family protein